MEADRIEIYRRKGQREVQGWLEPDAVDLTRAIDSLQKEQGIAGDLGEIGVHHGRFFIFFELLRRDDEGAVAIDLFDNQHLNRDGSGYGEKRVFTRNLERHGSGRQGVTILEVDSTTLHPEDLSSQFRLFSIDGGHSHDCVVSDLNLAEACLAEGGVVIVDDLMNEPWCEVIYGLATYKNRGGKLLPFGIFGGKLFLTDSEDWAARYRTLAAAMFADKLTLVEREFFGGAIIAHYPRPHWRVALSRRVRRNPLGHVFWKLYRRLKSLFFLVPPAPSYEPNLQSANDADSERL